MSSALPKLYVEPGAIVPPRTFLAEELYSQALDALIVICTDALIVDRGRRTVWLACRRAKPMAGLWVIGGRRYPGESAPQSIRRCFKRETKLDLPEPRFAFFATAEYLWRDRAQLPHDRGYHVRADTFAVELTPPERHEATATLDGEEYDLHHGLREFTREQLVLAHAHPVLVDFYDAYFGA